MDLNSLNYFNFFLFSVVMDVTTPDLNFLPNLITSSISIFIFNTNGNK